MAFAMATRLPRAAAPAAAPRRAPAVAAGQPAPRRAAVRARYTVTVRQPGGAEATFQCGPDELILDAAEAAGVDLPFMCRTGTCAGCTGRRVKGELFQPGQGLLSPEHEAQGFALLCSSHPRSDLVILSHQEETFIQESHIYDKQMNLKTSSR